MKMQKIFYTLLFAMALKHAYSMELTHCDLWVVENILKGERHLQDVLDKRGNINAQDKYGFTALHVLIINYYVKDALAILKLLLKQGIDIDLRGEGFGTALDYARVLVAVNSATTEHNPDSDSYISVRPTEVVACLEAYNELKQEVDNRPTQKTLEKAIKGDFLLLVKQLLLAGVMPTVEHVKIAEECKANEIGRLLIDYLQYTSDYFGSAKKSDTLINLPSEIRKCIVNYTL
jgi:Ankyrin repeat